MRSARPQQLVGRTAFAAAGIVLISALCAPAAVAQESSTRGGSAGCGQSAPESGRHEISSGDRKREFLLHLPDGYDGSSAQPVVFAFHGHGNNAANTEAFSKLSTLPAIVVYPEGVANPSDGNRQSWQGAPYAASGVDDVAFVGDLLDHLEETLCVDTARVYATGKSNGGGFTGLLACRMADRLAAVAPVAGAFYPATSNNCQPARPIPVIEFHGKADLVVPYEGGERDLPAIPDWMADWAARNSCPDRAPDERIEPDITISAWVGCAGGAEVRHVAIDGGGHTWPGADSPSGNGETTRTIEAHRKIWDFFQNHQLPSAG